MTGIYITDVCQEPTLITQNDRYTTHTEKLKPIKFSWIEIKIKQKRDRKAKQLKRDKEIQR